MRFPQRPIVNAPIGLTRACLLYRTDPCLEPAGCAGALIVNCFANPLLLQNDVYSSKGAALYEGAILEVKKRFSSALLRVGKLHAEQGL